MTRKTISGLLAGLLVLLVGGMVLGGQRAPKPPAPPATAAPPARPAVAEWDLGEAPELPEPPEPPQTPEPAVAGAMALVGDGGSWLGLRLADVTAEKARELKLSGEYGAVVLEVESDSPAVKAGVHKDDVITEFGGERVRSVAQLQRLVRETPAGRTVALQVSRGGQVQNLSVKLEGSWDRFRMPHVQVREWQGPNRFFFNLRSPALGISGEKLTPQLADYFGVKGGKGVLVREVREGSAAQKAGLKAGDVIVRVGTTEVGSVGELRRALPRDREEKRKVDLTIVRDRREQALSVELEAATRIRRAEHFEIPVDIPEVDLTGIEEMASEHRHLAAEHQKQLIELQKEVGKHRAQLVHEAKRLEKELKPQLEQLQLELQQRARELKEQVIEEVKEGQEEI